MIVEKGKDEKGEISEKLGITARPGYPVTESGKADLKLVKETKSDAALKKKNIERIRKLPESIGGKDIKDFGKIKKDRPNIRLMKNYEKELTDIELAQEGYNLQEITIIKRARDVMKKENQNPDDALAWVRGEMADEAGVEFEEFMTDFDWGDFPGGNASGGLPRRRYAMGSQGELGDLLVRLRNVVEGSGMYSNFSQNNRKSLQIALTSRINVLLGN